MKTHCLMKINFSGEWRVSYFLSQVRTAHTSVASSWLASEADGGEKAVPTISGRTPPVTAVRT